MARVVSLGIQIVDILGRPVTGIPEGQNVALLEEIQITVAGTAGGTSVDLAKLGAGVFAMGAVGEDELGNFLITTMQRYGINTSCLKRKSGVQTSSTMLPIRPNGDRPALQFPEDAETWRDATDEIRDLAHNVRCSYNELVLDVCEGDKGYIEALNFRTFKTPSCWNRCCHPSAPSPDQRRQTSSGYSATVPQATNATDR